jgi:hypothetical protein
MAGPFGNRFQPRSLMNMGGSQEATSEEEIRRQLLIQAEIKRRQQLQKARSGSLLRQQGTYEAAPKVTSNWDNLFTPNKAGGVNLNSPFNIGFGKPTIEVNERNIRPGYSPQRGRGGLPSQMYGVPQRVRGLGTGSEVHKPADPRGQQLGKLQVMPEEEDEFMSYDDQMFLLALMEGMQGGPPPTPYGYKSGGGTKDWASLPFGRMA